MLEKGMSTSIWIWIIGGLMIAMITFIFTFQSMVSVGETSRRNNVVDQFNNVKNTVDLYCSKGRGSMTTQTVSLTGVRGIYASNNRGNPTPEIPKNISESDYKSGKYLCLKFEGDENHFACRETSCRVNMTYIGTPIKGSDMYILGNEEPGFNFDLEIKKKADGTVDVEASHKP
jgi:hypothetical protein